MKFDTPWYNTIQNAVPDSSPSEQKSIFEHRVSSSRTGLPHERNWCLSFYAQSSRCKLRVFLRLVHSRIMTSTELITMNVIPVARIVSCKLGPPSKLGGSPLGLSASGIWDKSTPGGTVSIVMQRSLLVNQQSALQLRRKTSTRRMYSRGGMITLSPYVLEQEFQRARDWPQRIH